MKISHYHHHESCLSQEEKSEKPPQQWWQQGRVSFEDPPTKFFLLTIKRFIDNLYKLIDGDEWPIADGDGDGHDNDGGITLGDDDGDGDLQQQSAPLVDNELEHPVGFSWENTFVYIYP